MKAKKEEHYFCSSSFKYFSIIMVINCVTLLRSFLAASSTLSFNSGVTLTARMQVLLFSSIIHSLYVHCNVLTKICQCANNGLILVNKMLTLCKHNDNIGLGAEIFTEEFING